MNNSEGKSIVVDGGARIRKLLEKIETLRTQWSLQSYGIERTHGENDSAAKAFKCCSEDLFKIIHNE